MEKFLRIIDGASVWTGKLASFLVILLILAIGYDITVRYLFATPNLWAYDSTYMIYGGYTMLGAAYCHCLKGHVRMDLLYGRLSERGKAITDVICIFCCSSRCSRSFCTSAGKTPSGPCCTGNAVRPASGAPIWRRLSCQLLSAFYFFISKGSQNSSGP
jgi:hypothetical protein